MKTHRIKDRNNLESNRMLSSSRRHAKFRSVFVSSFIILLAINLCCSWAMGASERTPSVAYLDPGTGSMVLQMIIAGLVGVSFFIKIYWGRLKTLLTKRSGPKEEEKADDN